MLSFWSASCARSWRMARFAMYVQGIDAFRAPTQFA